LRCARPAYRVIDAQAPLLPIVQRNNAKPNAGEGLNGSSLVIHFHGLTDEVGEVEKQLFHGVGWR
jgi:hypothetical protein